MGDGGKKRGETDKDGGMRWLIFRGRQARVERVTVDAAGSDRQDPPKRLPAHDTLPIGGIEPAPIAI